MREQSVPRQREAERGAGTVPMVIMDIRRRRLLTLIAALPVVPTAVKAAEQTGKSEDGVVGTSIAELGSIAVFDPRVESYCSFVERIA